MLYAPLFGLYACVCMDMYACTTHKKFVYRVRLVPAKPNPG